MLPASLPQVIQFIYENIHIKVTSKSILIKVDNTFLTGNGDTIKVIQCSSLCIACLSNYGFLFFVGNSGILNDENKYLLLDIIILTNNYGQGKTTEFS